MTFVQRNRLRAALAVLLAAVSVLVLLTRLHYAPVLAQLAALQLDNQASAAINDAVQDTLTAEEITYDKLVELEKDTQGNVTAVRSNVAGLNRFRTALTARIDENLADLSVEELGIPVGKRRAAGAVFWHGAAAGRARAGRADLGRRVPEPLQHGPGSTRHCTRFLSIFTLRSRSCRWPVRRSSPSM